MSYSTFSRVEEIIRGWAVTQAKVDISVEEHQSSSKTTSSELLVSMFLTNNQKQTSWGWYEGHALTAASSTCQKTPELAGPPTGAPLFSQTRADSQWTWVTDLQVSGEAVESAMLSAALLSCHCLRVDQWWFGKATPWWKKIMLRCPILEKLDYLCNLRPATISCYQQWWGQ